MDSELIIAIILAIVFSAAFFFIELYHEHFRLHDSIIAGLSVSYFFLIVLPEISKGLPTYPLHLENFEYISVLLGFSFIHLSEKFILQHVERSTQDKARKFVHKESMLEIVEDNLTKYISSEINSVDVDNAALRELVSTTQGLHRQGIQINQELSELKERISEHIHDSLGKIRYGSTFFYHFLIGIILIGLLIIDPLDGVFFFVFAFFMALISKRYQRRIVFSDLDIVVNFQETRKMKYYLALSVFFGVTIGFLLDSIFKLNLEVLYILLSFIAGVILYSTVKYVIPEKEKGKPWWFLWSILGFSGIVLLIKLFQYLF